jgi:hypothetical protein
MPPKEAPQWQAAAASGSVYAGTLDESDNNTAYPDLQLRRLPIGFDPLKFPIIARHWLGFERGGRP